MEDEVRETTDRSSEQRCVVAGCGKSATHVWLVSVAASGRQLHLPLCLAHALEAKTGQPVV